MIEQLVAFVRESEVEELMDRPLQSLGGKSIRVLDGLSEDQKHAAYRELMAEREWRDAEVRQKALVKGLQETLHGEALCYRGAEWADFWMDAKNSVLENQRPRDVCVDKAGLERCREALKAETRKRRA